MGERPSSSGPTASGFWRKPGAAAIAIAVVCVPLILLLGEAGVLVGLVGLCLYPFLDVPRILSRPSWWRAVAFSVFGWIGLFIAIMGAMESVRHLGTDAMVFLLPFMLYPIALAVSGVVRLGGVGAQQGLFARRGGLIVVLVCGLFIVVPLALNMIPAVIMAITGNSPPNTEYSSEGEVLSATPGQVTVALKHEVTEVLRLGPDTTFDFEGPGWKMVEGEPGPSWLKAGQRVAVRYVYRNRIAEAQRVSIWVERKGCAGNAKWMSAMQALGTASPAAATLTGTTWTSFIGPERPGRSERVVEFRAENVLAFDEVNGIDPADSWKQDGQSVLMQFNNCYAMFEGRIEGDDIMGQWWNEMGEQTVWTARRKAAGSLAAPK
jgi:hypothetical protein